MAFCTQCGSASSQGHRYCVVCGAPLPASTSTAEGSTATSANHNWTPAPPLREDASVKSSSQVLFGVAALAPRQSRLTVLFRGVLCLPLFVWLVPLSLAAGLCVIVAWFAALFTRRVPPGIQSFVTDVLRYSSEVQAYGAVLVSRWPGFLIRSGPRNQVTLQVNAFELNRAAVFFRYYLSIPALIVSFLVSFAAYVLTFLAWITALILGRPAAPVYQARTLALRFSTRFAAYMYLLTPTQPFSGFFGDPGEVAASLADVPAAVPAALSTRLHLSRAGRVVFILSMVAGLLIGGLYAASFKGTIGRVLGPSIVSAANHSVVSVMDTFVLEYPHCAASHDVVCVSTDAATGATALTSQINALNTFEGLVSRGHGQYALYLIDVTKVRDDLTFISSHLTFAVQNETYRASLVADYAQLENQYLVTYSAV